MAPSSGKLLALAAIAVSTLSAVDARADLPSWFHSFEGAGTTSAPAKLRPLGPQTGPTLVLFQSIRVTRPSDIPPPKPAKGVGLVFDW